MPIIYNEVYRPAAMPIQNLPFGIKSAGHYKIRPPFVSHDYQTDGIHLYWCVGGSGIMEVNHRNQPLRRRQLAIYYPNMRHHYYARDRCWELYWLKIDGLLGVTLLAAFGLEAGIYSAGEAPVEMFKNLFKFVPRHVQHAERKACEIAFMILARAMESRTVQTDELVNHAVRHIHKQFMLPELNVNTLSDSLGVKRAVLSVRFHNAMGMPPSAYIHRLRIHHALSLLKNTRLPIAVIAGRCGYEHAHYFSRAIRHTTGKSPLLFRKYAMNISR